MFASLTFRCGSRDINRFFKILHSTRRAYRFSSNLSIMNTSYGSTSNREFFFSRSILPEHHDKLFINLCKTYSTKRRDGSGSNHNLNISHSLDSDDGKDTAEKTSMNRLLDLSRPERNLIGSAIGAQAITAGGMMLVPFAVGQIVDAVQLNGTSHLDQILLGMCGVFAVSSLANVIRVSCLSLAGSRVERTLRRKLYSSILRQETSFFDARQSGELVNRLSADVSVVSKSLTQNITQLVRSSIISTGAISLLLYISPKLSIIALSSFPPIVIFAFLFSRTAKRLSQELVDALASATEVAADKISSIRTVRYLGAEKYEAENYSKLIDATYGLSRRVALADGVYAGSLFMAVNFSLLGVLYLGGHAVASNIDPLTVGNLASFAMYAVQLGASISSIGSAYGQLSRALGAGHRIFEILDREPQNSSSSIAKTYLNEKGNLIYLTKNYTPLQNDYIPTIRFKDISFSYTSHPEQTILSDFNLEINPGIITAVAGGSGSGKSTIAALLMNLYEPSSGSISLSNIPISKLDPELLRRDIAIVPQEPVLFDGTVRENISYGMKNVSMERIIEAAKQGSSHKMIRSLPFGYDTRVGERGENLSGGQKARISLCRAILRKPRVLILDEHSSALDTETEDAITNSILDLTSRESISTLIIAHRVSTLQKSQMLAFLEGGKIVEYGPYEELVNNPESRFRRVVVNQRKNS